MCVCSWEDRHYTWQPKIIIMRHARSYSALIEIKIHKQELKGKKMIDNIVHSNSIWVTLSFIYIFGRTALHLAVCRGHARIVKLLLDYDCDVNVRDMVKLYFDSLNIYKNQNFHPKPISVQLHTAPLGRRRRFPKLSRITSKLRCRCTC